MPLLNNNDLITVIEECREIAKEGLSNNFKATIQPLKIVFVSPPKDFIGLHNNPAIYVSKKTHLLLGKYNYSWEVDKTIVVRTACLNEEGLRIIGILCHEVGHAFNVYAGIPNTEANACVFEIETLSKLFNRQDKLINGYSKEEILKYFESRIANYKSLGFNENSHLIHLVKAITNGNIFEFIEKKPSDDVPKLSNSFSGMFSRIKKIEIKNQNIINSERSLAV